MRLQRSPIEQRLHRIKSSSALVLFGCIAISVFGTVRGMVRSFNSTALAVTEPAQAELAESIQWSMTITLTLMPITLFFGILWIVCWYKLRKPLTIGIGARGTVSDVPPNETAR